MMKLKPDYRSIELSCELLSPVHVGTGEEIPLYEYVIEDGMLMKLNFDNVIQNLTTDQLKRFNGFNQAGNFFELRGFLTDLYEDQALRQKAVEYSIPVTPGVEGKYREKIADPKNQLLINLNQRNPYTHNPIIPGSSIKGAIRTAVLSRLAEDFDPAELPHDPQRAEMKILNAFDREKKRYDLRLDAFKHFKMPDINLSSNTSFICDVKNVKKTETGELQESKIQMSHEVLHSRLSKQPINFKMKIVHSSQMRIFHLKKKENISIDTNYIIDSCRTFYKHKSEVIEGGYFANTPVQGEIDNIVSAVDYSKGEFLLRVGRFSGKQSITLDKHRTGKEPKSRNLADGKYPMGWIKCRKI